MAAKRAFAATYPSAHKKQPKPEKAPLPTGPTRNLEYNRCFAVWQDKKVAPDKPECEQCGKDLSRRQVYDVGEWVCAVCKRASDYVAPTPATEDRTICHRCYNKLLPSAVRKQARHCQKCLDEMRSAK